MAPGPPEHAPPDLRILCHAIRNDLTVVLAHAQNLLVEESDSERRLDLEAIIERGLLANERVLQIREHYPDTPET
jgi:hypothetical protein